MTVPSTHAQMPQHHGQSHRRQRGVTLIELMIALLVGSILIGFVLSIFTRLSNAYRTQNAVSEVQQGLRGAKELLVNDFRAAGYKMPNGFAISDSLFFSGAFELADQFGTPPPNLGTALRHPNPATPANYVPPIVVHNNVNGDGSDIVHIFYANATASATVVEDSPSYSELLAFGADAAKFQAVFFGDVTPSLVVVVDGPRLEVVHPTQPPVANYDVCLVRITSRTIQFDPTTGEPQMRFNFNAFGFPFNTGTNNHCDFDGPGGRTGFSKGAKMYNFVGRAYRIDNSLGREESAILQVSPTGRLLNDWDDLGVGFTDLQFSRRVTETPTGISDGDMDLDGDIAADWYSGNVAPPVDAIVTEIGFSLATRTFRQLDMIGSRTTPRLTVVGNENHNQFGDSASITLEGVPDASRPPRHRGDNVYRWTAVRVDTRNVGIGL